VLKIILNIIWLVLAGWSLAIAYAVAGTALMITVIGFPFGVQAWKLAVFVLWPFGRVAVPVEERSEGWTMVGNVLWLIIAGWWIALLHGVVGLFLCATIIGIPLGIQSFKMAGLALWPFGRTIVDASTVDEGGASVFYLD